MKMLYEARLEDLGPHDFVQVKCAACAHAELIQPASFLHGLRLPSNTMVVDLER